MQRNDIVVISAANMVQTWDHDLVAAIRPMSIEPLAQARVALHLMKEGMSYEMAMEFEQAAAQAAGDKHKIYLVNVQHLRRNPSIAFEEYRAWCRRADTAVTKLGSINEKRRMIVEELTNAKFECPEVPEANDTNRKCKCGSSDVTGGQRQTRSADEGMTVIYVCNTCKAEFR